MVKQNEGSAVVNSGRTIPSDDHVSLAQGDDGISDDEKRKRPRAKLRKVRQHKRQEHKR